MAFLFRASCPLAAHAARGAARSPRNESLARDDHPHGRGRSLPGRLRWSGEPSSHPRRIGGLTQTRLAFVLVSHDGSIKKAPMPITARISAIWSRQKLLVAIFFVVVSSLFYFDGAV